MNECNFRFNALLQKQQKIMQLVGRFIWHFFFRENKNVFYFKKLH